MDDLVQKLRSQIGDDVAVIYDNEQLFRMASDEIERLRAWAEAAEAERDAAVMEQSEAVRRRIEAEAERDRIAAEWAEVSQRNYQRAKKAEAEVARLREALQQIAEPGFVQDKDAPMFAREWGDIARAALSGGDDG